MSSVAPFTIGTSGNVAPFSFGTDINMSLDDILKKRRDEQKKAKQQESRQRVSVKSKSQQNAKMPSTDQKTTGANKAKRNAKINARRGITHTEKATSMEIEKEVNRQHVGPKGQKNRRSNTNKNTPGVSGKSVADTKMKVKNQSLKQKQTTNGNAAITTTPPPPKKAVKAALNAMKEVGFSVPKGMKMVVSFVPGQNSGQNSKGSSTPKQNAGNQQQRRGDNRKGNQGGQQNQPRRQGRSNNSNNNSRRGGDRN